MGTVRSAEWCDARFRTQHKKYSKKPHELAWYPLWKRCADLVREQQFSTVIDLGCGYGHLGQLLTNVHYFGLDFSQQALKEASKSVPSGIFLEVDLSTDDWYSRLPSLDLENTLFACCEALEHIEDDLALLESLPPKVQCYLTFPQKDSAGHVRHFKSLRQVLNRYSKSISISEIEEVGQFFYLIGATHE